MPILVERQGQNEFGDGPLEQAEVHGPVWTVSLSLWGTLSFLHPHNVGHIRPGQAEIALGPAGISAANENSEL